MNDHPGIHPELEVSRVVKTYSALWRPFFAMASTHTMMARTPAKVQKMAKVYT
jgi:hypothetical protein